MWADRAPFRNIVEKQRCIEARPPQQDLHGQHFKRLTVDCCPDVYLFVVDVDVRLIECHLLALLAAGLEEVLEPMKPPVDRLVRAPDERSNIPIGQPGVVQERPEDTLFKPLSAINDLLQMSELEIRPLIKRCIHAPYDHAHSARTDVDLYAQRSRTEP